MTGLIIVTALTAVTAALAVGNALVRRHGRWWEQ